MSRKGNGPEIRFHFSSGYDNPCMDSFFATLKQDLVYHGQYLTWQEARQDIFEYIQVWYNRKRKHSALGNSSPEDFLTKRQYQMAA